MNTNGQILFDDLPATATPLACVARINKYNGSTSTFSLVDRELHELIPGLFPAF